MKTLTETYKAIKKQNLRIEAHELQMMNVPSWRVSEHEKQENIQACKKAIQDAKAELIQLYKNLIIDCETELELLQPSYSKKPAYMVLQTALDTVKKNKDNYAYEWAYLADLHWAEKQLNHYINKHNISPENKEV